MRLAFLGTGLMGAPMAQRLLAAGYSMTVWNRTAAKAEALAPLGASIATSPAEATSDAELVFLILENGPAVESVLFHGGAVDAAGAGTLFIDMSSIAPALAREHSRMLQDRGHRHLDAPVSGGPGGAREGSLAIMTGGEESDFRRAEPILSEMGRPTLVGPSGSGQLAKLTSQMIASAALAAVAESLLLARAAGIDPMKVREALAGGFADSKILRIHGERMVQREFEPGGHVHTFVKDLDAARSVATGLGLDLPLTSLAASLFRSLAAQGHGQLDVAAIALEIEARNGSYRIGEGPTDFGATG